MQRVTHIITGLSRGGAESTLYRLVCGQIDPSTHSVISLTDEGLFGERLRALGVEVRCLGLQRGRIPSPVAIWQLKKWVRELAPAVVQTWMYHADLLGGIAARLAGVPVCWGIRHSNLSVGMNKRMTLKIAALCARLSFCIPVRIVSCSAQAIEVHRTIGYADKFDLIPNGIDLSRFRPIPDDRRRVIRSGLSLPLNAKVIGHLGRADSLKDHGTLLATFARIAAKDANAWLLLAGKGLQADAPYFRSLADAHVLGGYTSRIVALGERDDVPELMGAMDIFLLSSVGEAFPNVLAEAMACGVPCVTTDVGDAAAIVGETGWVRQPGDAEGLAEDTISAFGESPERKEVRSADARSRIAEKFSIERMVSSYQHVWAKAIL